MIYKIRVILDAKEDVFRDIEIKGKQTLWNLNKTIREAFRLEEEELSTFNLLEEDGAVYKTVFLEDMSDAGDGEVMSDVYIDEAFAEPGDKAQFQYGLLDLWEFFCEVLEISEAKGSQIYPHISYSFGAVPLKAPQRNTSEKTTAVEDYEEETYGYDEFDEGFGEEEDDFLDEGSSHSPYDDY